MQVLREKYIAINYEKNSNKGFSLVEVLLSITVLAIVAIPVSSVFLSSAEYTARTAELGAVTQISENITEQFETMDFTSFLDSSTAPIIDGGTGVQDNAGMFVTPNTSTPELDYIPITGEVEQNGTYHIEFNGVTAGFSQYNAVVTLDASDANTSYDNINNKEIFENTSMDYIAAQTRGTQQDPDSLAWQAFLLECVGAGYVIDDENVFKQRVKAERTINVSMEEVSDKIHMTAQYEYLFTFPQAIAGESVSSGVPNSLWNHVPSVSEMSITPPQGASIPEDGEYPSFYMLFYPWYNGTDKFFVRNLDDLPVTFVFVKQVDSSIPQEQLYLNEINYKPTVAIIERNYVELDMIIHSNLSKNIADPSSIDIRVPYWFGTMSVTPGDITMKTTLDRLYNITVDIFERDALGNSITTDGPLYSMSSTNLQ